ncbi:hypothetical protein APHAL10511_006421 [Amanita phalloides]|nr:hypothetical protein APHAL10511_006421 [Amanita phalloides]
MADSRFDRLRTDPRFRLPKKKHSKLVVDKRFKGLFTQKKKRGRVDKYGRPVSETHDEDDLKRFYRLDDDAILKVGPDYARGQVLLQSSDEENEEDDKIADESEDSEDVDEIITIGVDELEVDLDEDNFADLDAQATAYSHTHPTDDNQNNTQPVQHTKRLAAVNLDWDHVRAIHLYKICSSLASPAAPLISAPSISGENPIGSAHNVIRGQVLSVRIYPSQFGKERMAREEKEGPPAEIFKRRKHEDEEITENNIYDLGNEADYDEDTLRRYQLERLRYYYAIITCDTADTATHIYTELDGTELERSANVFDLSFVPEGMTFDDECRDEATEKDMNSSFKGLEFVTDALRHSKVRLTWDDDDSERMEMTRRKLTRKEIEEADFRAILASSSGSENELEGLEVEQKQNKKAADRDKFRTLLLQESDDHMPEGWVNKGKTLDDVDMEITFTPGLTEKQDEEPETTLEKYQKKIREKRKKRKEEKQAPHEGNAKAIECDEFFAVDSGEEGTDIDEKTKGKSGKNAIHKSEAAGHQMAVSAEELALLVASDSPNSKPKHFNLKTIIKEEKRGKLRGKKAKKLRPDDENEIQEDFIIDVHDERFKALHENPQFAIDPSNPRFKKTKSMAALLEERQKRQRKLRDGVEGTISKPVAESTEMGLQTLVESVKRKSAGVEKRFGKRRKM